MILELKRPNLSRSTRLVPGFSQLQYEQAIQNNMTPDALQSFAARQGQKQLAAEAQRGRLLLGRGGVGLSLRREDRLDVELAAATGHDEADERLVRRVWLRRPLG